MSDLTGHILIADDEQSIRWVLNTALTGEGHQVEEVDGGEAARDRLSQKQFDLALIDIKMPDLDGLTLLSQLKDAHIDTPIVIITAQNTMANAIEAMKRGAYDYLTKPFDLDEVRVLVQRVLEMRRQKEAPVALGANGAAQRFDQSVELVGKAPAMQDIFKTIGRVAHTEATVLIQGESGTGKELLARAIHAHSARRGGPFVALNCSAVPRDLLESELFGHERGAFTGAVERRPGVFEVANGGTLFLDEIGDMPLELQAKLLRVVQERELNRVGGRDIVKIDARLVAATNKDLERAVRQGRFREDLFFRLNVVPITVPPLRLRRGDIPELVSHFISKVNRDMGTQVTGVSPEALALLTAHEWPGNVRELENSLVRAAVMAPGPTLMPRDLSLVSESEPTPAYDELSLEDVVRLKLKDYFRQMRDVDPTNLYDMILERIERPLIELTLERTGGNQLRAASLLGINRNTLHKKIVQLKIEPKRRPETEA
jgi:two-component system, NtrC family, nitrogen regulation response regulator GlnG